MTQRNDTQPTPFAAGDPILNRGAVNTALATAGWEITGRIADIDYAMWAVEIDQA